MKVLVMNSYYSRGGAARAALRLVSALKSVNIDVEYSSVFPPKPNFIERLQYFSKVLPDRFPGFFSAHRRVMFSQGLRNNNTLVNKINSSDYDIVHLHWMQGGGMSFSDILSIKKPVFISLHDMWLFTGGCHYDENCFNFQDRCGNCKVLNSDSLDDLSNRNWELKNSSLTKHGHSMLTVIGLSKWISEMAGRSSLLQGVRICNLPNPIDTKLFAPQPKEMARKKLGLPSQESLVLFGSMQLDDPRKGWALLQKALQRIKNPKITLVTFGETRNLELHHTNINIIQIGKVTDDHQLVNIYNAADVLVVPSIQENLSNAIMESLSCGTPVVGFDIGGNGDMISHQVNGYLARPFDIDDLAYGIEWVIGCDVVAQLHQQARSKVEIYFDQVRVGNKYKMLYEKALNQVNGLL